MKTTSMIVAVLFSGLVNAQQAELVNGFDGFENWVTAEVGELPNEWDGFNKNVQFGGMTVGTVECIEKSIVDPYEGTYSAKLTSTSIMGGPAVPGILTVGKFYLLDHPLDRIENLIDPAKFFRINRKHLIQLSSIGKMVQFTNSRLKVELKQPFDEELIVAREKVKAFKEWLEG